MRETPVFSVVGFSGSGKTTFLEKLVAELKKFHIRLAVIKHDAHGFEMDQEGKDTWRFAQAGADVVAISAPSQYAILARNRTEKPLDELISMVSGDVDLVLTEGYKYGDKPKIEVYRLGNGKPMVHPPEELIAVVTDAPLHTETPCFALDDAAGAARFLMGQINGKIEEEMKR